MRPTTTHARRTLRGLLVALLVAALVGCGGAQTTGAGPEGAPSEEVAVKTGETPVVALANPDSKTVSFSFAFRGGSTDDPEGREGLTALTAAMIAESGTERLTYPQLLDALFPLAARVDWSVGRDLAAFTGRVHVDHLERYYALLREVVLQPRLDEGSFERLRQKALANLTLALRTQDDEELGKAVLQAAIYAGHPYEHPEVGTEGGLKAMTLDDVKAQRSRVFCRERLTIGLAGAAPDGFAEKVRADLAALPRCTTLPRPLPAVPAAKATRVTIVSKPTADSTAISFGYPIDVNRDHPDYAALYLVTSWLGQHRNSVSHLFKKIREERGLNYGDYAYIEWWPYGGLTTLPPVNYPRRQQFFHVWLRPVPHETRLFALRAAVRELDRLAREGLSREDFEDIRRFIASYVSFYTITEERRLGYAIDDHFLGLGKPSLDALRAAWPKLTLEDVNAAVRRHLRADRLEVAVITNDAESLAAAMVAGDPSPITYASEKSTAILAEDEEIARFPIPVGAGDVTIVPYDQLFR
jgi:zinc protease